MQPSTLPIDFSFRSTLASAPFQPLLPHCVSRLRGKSSILISLRTLILSCRSFCNSRPFFSMPCGLFVQNTGGMGTRVVHLGPSHSLPDRFFNPLFSWSSKTLFSQPLSFHINTKPPVFLGGPFFKAAKKAAVLFDMATYERFAIQAILGRHRATIDSRS